MDRLRRSAQWLEPETSTLAAQLAGCPSFHDEALLWASVFEAYMGRYDLSGEHVGQIKQSKLGSSRMSVLSQASSGSYQALKDLVESDQPGWRKDAEANLVLARSLVRARRYGDARLAYGRYFDLKPDDVDIRIEAGFSFLSHDWRVSKEFFDAALQRQPNESSRAAAERGLEMVRAIRSRKPISSITPGGREVPLRFERFASSYRSFARQTLQTGYYTRSYEISAAGINLNSDVELTRQNAGEVLASRSFSFNDRSTSLNTRLGWFQATSGTPFGHLSILHSFSFGLTPVVGFEAEPWAKHEALPREFSSWTQRSIFTGFDFLDSFSYRFYHSTLTDQGASRKHSLLFTYPVWRHEAGRDVISLRLLGETISSEQFSSYIYSPKEANTILPGLSYERGFGSAGAMFFHAGYGTIAEVMDGPAGVSGPTFTSSSKGSLLELAAEVRARVTAEGYARVNLQYDRTASDGGATVYEANLIGIGFVWGLPERKVMEHQ